MAKVLCSVSQVSKRAGPNLIFEELAFSVKEGDRIALIGSNGAGKTTLLKIMCRQLEPDEGQVIYAKGLRLSILEQNEIFSGEETCLEYMQRKASEKGRSDTNNQIFAFKKWLSRVGIEDENQLASKLSGGWKKRLALAFCLFEEPELLLLDEPTNHLDFEGMVWLEGFLAKASFAWVSVTHDRYFIKKVARSILELDRLFKNGVFLSEATYDEHVERKAHLVDSLRKTSASLQNKLVRETEWASRMPKARGTKAKYRMDDLEATTQEHAALSSRLQAKAVDLKFQSTGTVHSRKIVDLEKLTHILPNGVCVVQDFTYSVTTHSRLAIIGANGAGKTTFLRLLQGLVSPTSGKVRAIFDTKIEYLDQEKRLLDLTWTLRRALAEDGDRVSFGGRNIHIASWAEKFLLDPKKLDLTLDKFSGGERARVALARIMARPCDVLILDEPTNDLDIQSLEALEQALSDFSGGVVLTSHDRQLIQAIATDYICVGIECKKTAIYSNMEQVEQRLIALMGVQGKEAAEKEGRTSNEVKAKNQKLLKLTYNEQRELDLMEPTILELESSLETLRAQGDNLEIQSNPTKAQEYYSQISSYESKLEKLYIRWEELETKRRPLQ